MVNDDKIVLIEGTNCVNPFSPSFRSKLRKHGTLIGCLFSADRSEIKTLAFYRAKYYCKAISIVCASDYMIYNNRKYTLWTFYCFLL